MRDDAARLRLLPTAADAANLGAAVARRLRRGEAVCLSGPLGAGKSTLARALIRALTTPDEEAPSPTFTLVQSYDTPAFPLAHFDLYRLRGPQDVAELGLDEALEDGAAIIEWPERLERHLPAHRLDIALSFAADAREGAGSLKAAAGGDEPRLARLLGHGAWTGRELDL